MRYWLPLLVWSSLLLLTSTDLFSSSHSGSIFALLLGRLLTPSQLEIVNFIFRKLMHLTGYAIEGAFGFRAARGQQRGFALRWAVAGVGIAVAVASIDEWHQTLVPSRGGSAQDVLLDGCGAVIAQLFAAARNLRR
jgi:VanZ family protein